MDAKYVLAGRSMCLTEWRELTTQMMGLISNL